MGTYGYPWARGNLLQTAQDHLRRVTGNDFTQKQIRGKLRLEWKNHGLCDSFDDVFNQGTPSLGLSDDEHNEILSIFTGLVYGRHELRSDTWATRTRSRAVPKTPRAKSPATRLKLPNKNSRTRVGASSNTLDCSADDDDDGDDAVNLIQVLDTESEISEPSPSSRPSLLSALQSPSPPRPGPAEQPSDGLTALQAEVLKLKCRNLALQNRVSELETEHAEISHLRNSTGGEIDECTRMVRILEKRIKAAQSTRPPNPEDPETRRLGLSEGFIMQEYKELYHSILVESQALCGDDSCSRISNNDENAHPARGWAMKASGWDLVPLLCHYNIEAIPSSRLIAALVGAGIFDLVFERVFPDVLGLESPLMNGYRRHILAKDGSEALRMADLAALAFLTHGDRAGKAGIKNQMIEEKAKYLSEFMLQSVSFCITAEDREVITPDDDDSAMEEMPPELDIPLTKALDLKFSLTTSMTRLKFYFFWPGHDFEDTSMERDDMSSNGSVVKLCLLPALFSVPRDRLGTRLEESRWEIETYYDRYLTEATKDEVASLHLVAKALVLT